MPFQIGDITIGKHPIIQSFGDRPQVYNARYNLKGHNGVDIGCPTQTPILSAANGKVIEAQFDANAYGYVIKILHEGFITTYGHLNDSAVKVGDQVTSGQLIGHSNNTGLSDTPHLHFGIAPADAAGYKILTSNGFGGYIDPMGQDVEWHLLNLAEPIYPQKETNPGVTINSAELSTKEINNNNYAVILSFCRGNGLDAFLSSNNEEVSDLDVNGGQKVNMFVASLLQELRDRPKDPRREVSTQKKTSLLGKFFGGVRSYIFTQKPSSRQPK